MSSLPSWLLSLGLFYLAPHLAPGLPVVHRSAIQSSVGSLDPLRAVGGDAQMVITNAFDGLVSWDNTVGIQPEIAESWSFSKDRRQVDFRLRPAALFQDGTPVDSAAVRRHFLRLLRSRGYYSIHYANIESIETPAPNRVVFRLKRPNPYFLHLLSGVAGRIVKLDGRGRIIGSGPFRPLVSADGKGVILNRCDKYWGERPRVDRLYFRVADESTALNLARRGELDDLGVFSFSSGARPRGMPDGRWLRVPIWATWAIAFDQRVSPLDREAVRKSLAGAIQSADWVRAFFPDQMPAAGLIPFGMPGYLEAADFAPKARSDEDFLRRNQRVTSGRVTIEIPDVLADRNRMADWIRSRTSGPGLPKINVKFSRFESMMARYAAGKMGAFLLSFNAEYPDPSYFLRALQSESKSNFLGVKNARVDRWIAAADAEADPVARARILRRLNAFLTKTSAVIPLMHMIHNTWVRDCAEGLRLSPVGQGYFNYRAVANSCR